MYASNFVSFSGEFSAETQCTSEEAISIWTSMPSCRPRETIVKVPQMADPRLFQVSKTATAAEINIMYFILFTVEQKKNNFFQPCLALFIHA